MTVHITVERQNYYAKSDRYGVIYLLYNDVNDQYGYSDLLLPKGVKPEDYITTDQQAIIDDAKGLPDQTRYETAQERNTQPVYVDVLRAVIRGIRNGDDLATINLAMENRYINDGSKVGFITDLITTYQNGTAQERARFDKLLDVAAIGLLISEIKEQIE